MMKKRIITFVVAVALIVVSAVPAFAVTEINSYEQQVLDLINDGIKIGEGTLDISRYYNQAYNFFLDNDKLNSQAQVDTIKGDIEAAANALVNYGITVDKNSASSFDVSKANASGKAIRDDMLGRINSLGREYGISGSYDPVKDVLTLKWDGGEFNSEDLIKQTGSESLVPPMVIGAALVLVVIAAGGFVYTRSRKIKD